MHARSRLIAIVIAFALGGGMAGCGTTPTVPGGAAGMTSEQVDTLPGYEPYTIRTSVYNASAQARSSAMYTVTITNRTTDADTYTFRLHSTHGWTDFSGLPATVALDGKASATFPFTVTIPVTARLGTTEKAAFQALSRARPYLHFQSVMIAEAIKPGLSPHESLEAARNALQKSDFKDINDLYTFRDVLEAVQDKLEAGDTDKALPQLEHDLLPRTDGCAVGNTPDADDWIRSCATQGKVYPKLRELIAALKAD